MPNIRSYKELRVYQAAIEAAMRIFEITKRFPAEERFSMVDRMRRLPDRFAQISEKRGGSVAIRRTLRANSATQKVKRKKLGFGSILHFGAVTFRRLKRMNLIK